MLTRCSGTPGHPALFTFPLSLSGHLTGRGPLRGDKGECVCVCFRGGGGGCSLSVSFLLSVGKATVRGWPRPPPTATLRCRRYVLVPRGRPLKRDSVTFRWNALGAHDSTEKEQRLCEAEREREKEKKRKKTFTSYRLLSEKL